MDNSDELLHITKVSETFLRNFIQLYRENRILWDKSHPQYKSRADRDAALETLVSKSAEYFPEANVDFVKTKIDSIRGTFRREYRKWTMLALEFSMFTCLSTSLRDLHKRKVVVCSKFMSSKVQDSKKKSKSQEDVYVPTLWYYNLLLFTMGEDDEVKLECKRNDPIQVSFWSKHYTVLLIELLKKHPVLYSMEPMSGASKFKRVAAYKTITRDLIAEVGRHFEVHEVKNKINTLKQQFRRELREQETKQARKTSKLWCYELLSFLEESSGQKKKSETTNKDDQNISESEGKNLWILHEYEPKSDVDKKTEELDDLFDTIGKNVAVKLRDMTGEQRGYAENLINEIMYNGLMENLGPYSKISFTGD